MCDSDACMCVCVCVRVCVYMTIRRKLDQIHNGLVVRETPQNCHRVRNISPTCPRKLDDGKEFALRFLNSHFELESEVFCLSLDVRHTVARDGVVGT